MDIVIFTTFVVYMFSKTFEILNIKLVIYLFTMSRSSLSVECLVNVGICFIRLCKRRKTQFDMRKFLCYSHQPYVRIDDNAI